MDTSTVFHIDILDAEFRKDHNEDEPWIFETDEGQESFRTERGACNAQCRYRIERGFNPITGRRG